MPRKPRISQSKYMGFGGVIFYPGLFFTNQNLNDGLKKFPQASHLGIQYTGRNFCLGILVKILGQKTSVGVW